MAQGEPVTICLNGLAPFQLRLHERTDRFVSGEIRRYGKWEAFETQVVLGLLGPGDVFVDIGANIGWYTVAAALRVGPRGKVIAFEPEPENFSLLCSNIALNGLSNCHAVPLALAECAGERTLFLSGDNLGDHRLYASDELRPSLPVRTTTLDDYFGGSVPRLDVVKMDTQGAEAHILAGMRRTLAHEYNCGHTALIVEFWPFGLAGAGTSADALTHALEGIGLSAWLIDERHGALVPVTWSELRARAGDDLHPQTRSFVNILALPAGREVPATIPAREQSL